MLTGRVVGNFNDPNREANCFCRLMRYYMCIIVNFFPLWTIQIEAIYIFLYALIIFNYNMAISLSIHQYLNIVMGIVYTGCL